MSPIVFLDYTGVAFFCSDGRACGFAQSNSILLFLFLSAVAGIVGGTARDLILDVPVFWVEQHFYILVCAATAAFVYFAAHLIEWRYRLLLWLNAVALSAYGVFGSYKGLMVTDSSTVAVVMGMITGTLGGILRDVLARKPSVLMRQEIYVAAAMAGAVTFVIAHSAGLSLSWAAGVGFLLALGARSGALLLGWTFPPYRSRAGRNPMACSDLRG